MRRCKWNFKKDNFARLYYKKHERVVENISKYNQLLKGELSGHIWTQEERN